jgi:hypothetical protein
LFDAEEAIMAHMLAVHRWKHRWLLMTVH